MSDQNEPKDEKKANENANDSETFFGSNFLFGDALKKIMTAGMSAAFMTEEHIRNYLSDTKLPKDILQMILSQAAKSKEDLMNRLTKEMSQVLGRVDFAKEIAHFAESHRFKITAEIDVIKKTSHSQAEENKEDSK